MEKQIILFFLFLFSIYSIEGNLFNTVYNLAIENKNILNYKNNNIKLSNSHYFEDFSNFRIIKNYNSEYYIT